MSRVGVVIPVRNRPSLVLEALESVRNQTLAPSQVVIVDDGSTDRTPDRIEDWLASHKLTGWQLIRAEHRGAAEARQHGFSLMPEVDLVAFLDSDDLWPPDLVRRAVTELKSDPGRIGASADRRITDESNGKSVAASLKTIRRSPLRWIVRHDAGIGSCTFIRATPLRSIGGYPTGQPTGHDILLFAQLMQRGSWGHLPGAPVVFRRHHAGIRGEADHIYRHIADANIRYARLYEQAIAGMPPRDAHARRVRQSMGRRWISAAKTAWKLGDTTGALECLAHAQQYKTLSIRAIRLKRSIHKCRTQPARPARN